MTDPGPAGAREAEALLRDLSELLDAADEPMQRLDLAQVEEQTREQERLMGRLQSIVSSTGGEPGTAGGIDRELVAEVRQKLLRNRVIAVHVLDFSAQLAARITEQDVEGYAPDGQARNQDGIICIAMYHPAAALHQPTLRRVIEEDFGRIPELISKAEQVPPEEPVEKPEQLSLF